MNTQIYDEASEWIILHRTDSLDADDRRRFDTWLRESPQHLRAYLEMSTIWEDVPALNRDWNPIADELIARARAEGNVLPLAVEKAPTPPVPAAPPAPDLPYCHTEPEPQVMPAELASASTEPALQRLPLVTVAASQHSTFWRYTAAVAATAIIAIGAAWLYTQRDTYTTDTGEQRTIALTDGSTVELNAQTKIRLAYTDHQRTIQLLRGQALFKVAKDTNRPFIVDTDQTRVRAVGTQFDVYRKSTGTQVTVVEGRVAVAAPVVPAQARTHSDEPRAQRAQHAADKQPRATQHAAHALQPHLGEVLLSAGEQILIAQATSTPELNLPSAADPIASVPDTKVSGTQVSGTLPEIKPANIEAATAWTQQRLVFDFTPLTEVANEFNRYNRRRLVIEDATLSDFNISGSFSSTDPTLLLRFLRDQPGIVVHETTDEIRISREDSHG